MSRDFTYHQYEKLLGAIIDGGFHPCSFEDFMNGAIPNKPFILRHDVDRKPENALALARIQKEFGVRGTYFWRIVDESYDSSIIEEVVRLGHEIGYHYEDMTLAKGSHPKAIELFEKHLAKFRTFYPVSTLCMHGSPLTKWDNREIWSSIDYKDYGLVGEPYYDVDFKKIEYFTDTGRAWNKSSTSVRDSVDEGVMKPFKHTQALSSYLKDGKISDGAMYNIHPHRWNDGLMAWSKELVFQNVKNLVKRALIHARS